MRGCSTAERWPSADALHQHDVILILRQPRLGLQRNRLADKLAQPGQMLAFLKDKKLVPENWDDVPGV